MIDTCLDGLTPRIVRRWAIRALLIAGPIAVIAFAMFVFRWYPEDRRGTMLMSYATAALVALTAVAVAALATCHMRIAGAFSAGYRTAQMNDRLNEEKRPALHVVE